MLERRLRPPVRVGEAGLPAGVDAADRGLVAPQVLREELHARVAPGLVGGLLEPRSWVVGDTPAILSGGLVW